MLLTVIIVTKDPGNDIFFTLSSLKKLDDSCVEIIIKDNSSHRELESVNEFYQFSNLRYIYSDDNGVYDAMNQSLNVASGKFIYFLNAGDLYLDCDLLNILKNDNENADFFYGNIVNLLPFIRLIRYSKYLNKYSVYLRGICHQSLVLKKDAFDVLGKFDENLTVNADYLFALRLLDDFKGKPLNRFIALYKGGGLSYDYQQTEQEKKYLKSRLREIFSAPELWGLSVASVVVKFLVYLKNFNKPT